MFLKLDLLLRNNTSAGKLFQVRGAACENEYLANSVFVLVTVSTCLTVKSTPNQVYIFFLCHCVCWYLHACRIADVFVYTITLSVSLTRPYFGELLQVGPKIRAVGDEWSRSFYSTVTKQMVSAH